MGIGEFIMIIYNNQVVWWRLSVTRVYCVLKKKHETEIHQIYFRQQHDIPTAYLDSSISERLLGLNILPSAPFISLPFPEQTTARNPRPIYRQTQTIQWLRTASIADQGATHARRQLPWLSSDAFTDLWPRRDCSSKTERSGGGGLCETIEIAQLASALQM